MLLLLILGRVCGRLLDQSIKLADRNSPLQDNFSRLLSP
jgi:hypothetical protein